MAGAGEEVIEDHQTLDINFLRVRAATLANNRSIKITGLGQLSCTEGEGKRERARERERETDREGEREGDRQREREREGEGGRE